MMLRSTCRYCKTRFSIQYPLVEIFTGVIFAYTWYLSNTSLIIPSDAYAVHSIQVAMAGVLIVMLLADFRYQIIPDEMQIALMVLGVAKIVFISIVLRGADISGISQVLGTQVLYGAAVMAPLLLVFLMTKGRGMGFGDVKLAFVMGFLLGLLPGYLALYIGFVIGGIVGGILLLTKKGKRKSKIAFGPFLILGLYIILFFEQDVILFVSKIYGF